MGDDISAAVSCCARRTSGALPFTFVFTARFHTFHEILMTNESPKMPSIRAACPPCELILKATHSALVVGITESLCGHQRDSLRRLLNTINEYARLKATMI